MQQQESGPRLARFDRYLLSRLLMLFGFFALVLVLVYWVNRAVILFDRLIASGQSAGMFLQITLLSLPQVIALVLPIAAFAASVFVANRLSGDSELVVMQATGFSPWRLIRPVLVFGILVGAALAVLAHVLVPGAVRELDIRQAHIAQNITSRLLTEGVFIYPAEGITFFVREITPEGELRDIFMADSRSQTTRTNYTARSALLLAAETGPKLVMLDGMAQTLTLDDQRLAVTRFGDFSFDIAALLPGGLSTSRRAAALPTSDLLAPSPAILAETGASPARLIAMGHERFSQSLLAVVAALLGFATLLLGGFSRFGLWRQIILGVALVLVIKSVDNTLIDIAERSPGAWPAIYGASMLGFALVGVVLWAAARPALFRARASGVRA